MQFSISDFKTKCDNTYSLGKYSPNSKKYRPESGTPTLNEGEQRGERD